MRTPSFDPPVADRSPDATILTAYDEEHLVTYLWVLDANSERAGWREVARIVLHIDPVRDPKRARRAWKSHLTCARWMTMHGYEHLLRGGPPN
jgi:type VI secretion system activator RovC-like protein